jgi:hypothetical protein
MKLRLLRFALLVARERQHSLAHRPPNEKFQSRSTDTLADSPLNLLPRHHGNLQVRQRRVHTTTPFDKTVFNEVDRYHLASDAVDRSPRVRNLAGHFKQFLRDKLIEHRLYIARHGEDMPKIRDWKWSASGLALRSG